MAVVTGWCRPTGASLPMATQAFWGALGGTGTQNIVGMDAASIPSTKSIPEPATWTMLLSGLIMLYGLAALGGASGDAGKRWGNSQGERMRLAGIVKHVWTVKDLLTAATDL
jgi:hypothetical protein